MKIIKRKEDEVFDVELEESLLEKNRKLAEENKKLLEEKKIRSFDLMGSIGSGKTTLITQMIKRLKKRYQIAAIAGDLTTTLDAKRLRKAGAVVVQINTGKECHLDANLVKRALSSLPLDKIDLIFIENVGNLICPAEFPLGTQKRLVVISTTEGPYMVTKHPYVFFEADLVAVNKLDLAKEMRVSFDKLKRDINRLQPKIPVIGTSARKGKGIKELITALGL